MAVDEDLVVVLLVHHLVHQEVHRGPVGLAVVAYLFAVVADPIVVVADHLAVAAHLLGTVDKSIVLIHNQLLDWPFTRLLLEALCIKTRNYLQVKGIDL